VPERIAPAIALAHLCPDFFDGLTDAKLLAAAFDLDSWLRPEQRVPAGDWLTFGVIAGRGWGKTFGFGFEFNRRVANGSCRAPALMAPNDDRIVEVQVKTIVETAPPWFKPAPYHGTVRWPNGVVAEAFTPEAPGRSRSGNFDLTWMTEIVDWAPNGRLEAYLNLSTATRVRAAQILWDTTSKGKNEVIQLLLGQHESNPKEHRLVRGTAFDNPMLSPAYLRKLCGQYPRGSRRYQEEIEGKVFSESAGALWQQAWIDLHRANALPGGAPARRLVGLDPALSARADADETGIVVGSEFPAKGTCDVFVEQDLSGHLSPEQWAGIVVDQCVAGAAGVVVERNHLGDTAATLLKVHAAKRGMRLQILTDPSKPFPRATKGVLYVRETTSTRSKEARAQAPAALYSEGRVHHVGQFDELELELTTWEPGGSKSPNRLDALSFVVAELADIPVERKASQQKVVEAAHVQAELVRRLRSSNTRGRLGR